ncbi:MAG: ABC transporter ATP-binding protein [Acidobacteriota bacterium]|jgi:ABC-2 type transport system ATP-binding protein
MTVEQPAIEIVQLTKTYGQKTAVRELSLRFEAGRIHCLLGPNGAGKTTTIKTIMGLKNPTSGDVRINGVSIRSDGIHEARRGIGYLPEEPLLYDHLTGREFLQFVSEIYGVSGRRNGIEGRLAEFEMQTAGDEPIRTYSLGMKKKIAFLATLISDPPILIYDEPTSALDALSARKVKEVLSDYRSRGRLVLFTTHILEIAERLADRIAIMDHGALRFSGSLEELRNEMHESGEASLEDLFVQLVADGKGQSE